jgi:hypothetical protein
MTARTLPGCPREVAWNHELWSNRTITTISVSPVHALLEVSLQPGRYARCTYSTVRSDATQRSSQEREMNAARVSDDAVCGLLHNQRWVHLRRGGHVGMASAQMG